MFVILCACNQKKGNITNNGSNAAYEVNSTIHFSVDESEKIDRTIKENYSSVSFLENENGAIIDNTKNIDLVTYIRRFIIKYEINKYCYDSIRKLYDSPNLSSEYRNLQDGIVINTLAILQKKDENGTSECWLNVQELRNKNGWIYLGSIDPYKNNNWEIIGTINIDGKEVMLRKYTHSFSVTRNKPAYDKPSLNAKIIWRAERTDNNPQINVRAICVTSDTYQGRYFQEHWVKIKDSYDRIGWMPGDVLDVERGGAKYLSPENIVLSSIYEP